MFVASEICASLPQGAMHGAVYDFAVVGGGIVGLATARELLKRAGGASRVAVLEAETGVARHQSGRNSGVVHAGLYYAPGSLKARLCAEGMRRSYAYFEERGVPYRKVGKVVVALDASEVPALDAVYAKAVANGVPGVRYLATPAELREVEPECAGVCAIHSPETGIVDWGVVAECYARDVQDMGGDILLKHRVVAIEDMHPLRIRVEGGTDIRAERVVTCAGVQSDRVASMLGGAPQPQILPVRGEYLRVTNPDVVARIRGNIYPVPDSGAGSPFLGVHFTPTMSNELIVGPNAVLAFARDGDRYSRVNLRDVTQMLTYPGFWRLATKHFRYAAGEMYRSIYTRAAATKARRYVPALSVTDFARRSPDKNGIRAQSLAVDGSLLDDFLFEEGADGRVLHTRNAPSPGATSSLALARVIADRSLGSL